VIAHRRMHQQAELAAQLGTDAVSTFEVAGGHGKTPKDKVPSPVGRRSPARGLPKGHRRERGSNYSVLATSVRSKHSIWSPGLTSLYCLTAMPHSMPLRTSSTSSLKRRSDSSSPSKITTLSRSTRIGLLRLTVPSVTMQPATAPTF